METSQTTSSIPSLLCEEDESCFTLNNESDETLCQCCIFEYDDEYIEMLIHKESDLQSNTNKSLCNSSNDETDEQSWSKRARLHAVQWILDTRALFGLHFQTAYLSLIYFDGFFSKRSVEDGKLWAIRLLSIACLSLAAKMEEYKAPALSDYHIDECNFEGRLIQKMELLVLDALEWKMNVLTPFLYFRYFIAKFYGESRPKGLMSRAIELTLAMLKDISLVKYPPSMIAAVAVLAACDSQLTMKMLEFKLSIISSWGSSHKENVLLCYNLMREIQKAKSNTPNLQSPLSLSLKQSSSRDCRESSCIIGTKRRLAYPDSDQHQPLQRTRRSP
ncbi:unnamed protein product [Coffea canephora]|uniref:Cyclin N-terminal domain-containing protein n=1 Tax=Coffea canephora TaxID=49390 RepID=A0A068U246_COFCA|nr:unnamed protein product [Coffea canephora]